jgi:hypothetical protein
VHVYRGSELPMPIVGSDEKVVCLLGAYHHGGCFSLKYQQLLSMSHESENQSIALLKSKTTTNTKLAERGHAHAMTMQGQFGLQSCVEI